MVITKSQVETVRRLSTELTQLQEESSDLLKKARFGSENRKVMVKRKDVEKEEEITESLIWEEIFVIGDLSEGHAVLKAKYPEAFKKAEEHNLKAQELNKYTLLNFGIKAGAVSIGDIFTIVDAIVDGKNKE